MLGFGGIKLKRHFKGKLTILLCLVFLLGAGCNQHKGSIKQLVGVENEPKTLLSRSGMSQMDSTGALKQIKELSKQDQRVNTILSHINQYPDELLQLLVRNEETIGFVLNYPKMRDKRQEGIIKVSDLSSTIPTLLQWDERWGYEPYGNSIIGLSGCGPTALSMVIIGLTGNVSATPAAVATFSEENGYYILNKGTDWSLFTVGAKAFGIHATEIGLNQNAMIQLLREKKPLICSMRPGDFTTIGHFIVITDYKNGMFTIHDPNSKKRSEQKWSYERLEPQIRVIWSFELMDGIKVKNGKQ